MDSVLMIDQHLVIVTWNGSIGKGIRISQSSIIDLGRECGVPCYYEDMLVHLQMGLDNLRVNDLILSQSSRLSLTVAGMSLLLEGSSDPLSSISFLRG